MVYTKIKLKNHRKNSVEISNCQSEDITEKRNLHFVATSNFGLNFEILSFKTGHG